MILKVYSVFDVKVGAYLPPIFMRSNGEALRAFASAANSKDHDFCKYAEDYTLFEIGMFDDSCGQIITHSTLVPLGRAIEFIGDKAVSNLDMLERATA